MNPPLFAHLAAAGWAGCTLDRLVVRAGGALALVPGEATGTLLAGPLDAGEDGRWSRVVVAAHLPADARVLLDTATAADPAAALTWQPAPATDVLVDGDRYLWLRLLLEAGAATPVVSQLRAETEPDGYLDHLPAVYERADADGSLRRLLALAQSCLGDLQAEIDLLPRRFDPATADPATLPWLAGWQAFDAPPELLRGDRPDRFRELLAELPRLYARRGTPGGVARAVQIQTGVRPALFEQFRQRAGWVLGATGALGLDTALVGSSPDGLVLDTAVVGGGTVEDPADYGRGVFGDTAHRFTAVVPAGRLTGAQRGRIAAAIEAEKPAHTVHHLCLPGPAFRVGVQATVGLDTIVGRSPGRIQLT